MVKPKESKMNHTDPQTLNGPTHLYLLQMDPSIDLSSNEQVLPLHLLDNSLEFGRKQYLLPIPLKQKEGQDHLQVLIDSSQGPAKIMGLIVDNKKQNVLPDLDGVLQTSPEYCINTEQLPNKMNMHDLHKPLSMELQEDHAKLSQNNDSVEKIKNYVKIPDRVVPPRALAVLPTVLQIQRRHIISTRRAIPERARFGPVEGIKRKISQSEAVELVLNATSNKKPLFLLKDQDEVITYIDTSDKDKSNWIGLLPLGDQNSANVWIYEENQELYAITTEIVPSRKPLMIGYSKKYADAYGLIGPTKDLDKEIQVQKSWWCHECQQTLRSAKHLETHAYFCHKDENEATKRRYRCRHCRRTFSRIFALRRHTTHHCPVKLAKNKETNDKSYLDVEVPPLKVNVSMCSEDNKLPSDESFQNYTNGLDFSTNLFDTDRISSLDISGNSRSDNEFNPYAIGYRDENVLTSDIDFTLNCENPNTEKPLSQVEEIPVTCPHCDQIVAKGKGRQHVSKCPGRQFKCVNGCGKVFTSMKQLTEHIWAKHSNENSGPEQKEDNYDNNPAMTTNTTETVPVTAPAQYKCEQCEHSFKRRGMLVIHLWRVHNTVSAGVPLERRVRHFPCGTCPKIYRTAAKRDRHVQKHHPGAAKSRLALEGGTRVCEPAMCPACPRQYATRAKLLQHQRAHHPFLITLPKTKNKVSST
ncbi:hypothetical protein PYW08_002169 [Mythimna loreyi]|uniref:Uncharacterized protein n=1 Tax=Mythimna loreyi TaxID=667449 RepID=A0ACC2R102_9NEOP|nr:hypothetical protein PYW08_002169 [Mythimna loreyi]